MQEGRKTANPCLQLPMAGFMTKSEMELPLKNIKKFLLSKIVFYNFFQKKLFLQFFPKKSFFHFYEFFPKKVFFRNFSKKRFFHKFFQKTFYHKWFQKRLFSQLFPTHVFNIPTIFSTQAKILKEYPWTLSTTIFITKIQ